MSQDIIADALNMIKNAKKAGKDKVEVKKFSKVLIEILKIMRQRGVVRNYKVNTKEKTIEILIGELSESKAIKPRYTVKKEQIDKYVRRYLPARDYGTIIISTNKGFMTHEEALEKNLGGCLIAYFY